MLAAMPVRVYEDWKAFGREEPFWAERADYRAALVAYTVAITAPRKKGSRIPKFKDFVLKFGAPDKKEWPTGQQMFHKIRMITMALGGSFTDTRGKD